MEIEYLEAFEELQDENTFKGQQWFGKRKDLVEKYSWAVPSEEAVLYLSEFGDIVEVGAGSGYWANCVNEEGGNVMPYDINPPDDTWTEVQQADVFDMGEAAFEHPVLLVWPELDEGVATEVAERGPPHILYVGESRGGCTAEDEFFDELDQRYGLIAKLDIPSYAGIRDSLFHYVRKV